jgi:hypothetical protein
MERKRIRLQVVWPIFSVDGSLGIVFAHKNMTRGSEIKIFGTGFILTEAQNG